MSPEDKGGTTLGAIEHLAPTLLGDIKALFSISGFVCNWGGRPFYLRAIIFAA